MESTITRIIGVSQTIKQIRDLINHVADTGLNVIISGESGVGKEVVAQNLYQMSQRVGKPFIKVNCAALPDGLLESELFGYEQGAFTGAERKKRGKFELAHEGVLFLDEIGDMSLSLQSKLLHALQSGEFTPLGSEKEVKTDAWIISATNHQLDQDVKSGSFREDLYYRLNIINISISPLRNRPEDIPPLVEYYLKEFSLQFDGNQHFTPDDKLIEKLTSYYWPGNVRELQNVLKRIRVLGNEEEVIRKLASNVTTTDKLPPPRTSPNEKLTGKDILGLIGEDMLDLSSFSFKRVKKKALDIVEKEMISYVLDKTGWNRTRASKILNISYKTLLTKISDLEIEPPVH